jgi:hypothetical protein
MTRAQQTQILTRLRELEAALASLEHGLHSPPEHSAPYLVGQCRAIVEWALRDAGETPIAKLP